MLSHKPVRRCSQYKAVADEHNLNNRRYAAFLKSSAKIKADLSQFHQPKQRRSNTRLAMGFCFCTFNGTCTKGAPLEEEEALELDHILEKHGYI
ncbi:hypothetical protein AVEN_115373-1 [Araneus ventricosus]|uniref:Uncharacterized protein n=1 Tax=Araneus ventricosus TaxID=182803 RepID=A0A4Y1ZY93_ARAVE|nr:hypothetical protein AVEN_115373-1 [Araneus ventricosus]